MRFLVRTAAWMSALILFAGGTAFAQEPEATEEEYTQVVGTHPQDPWERYNRAVFTFNETVDRYTLKPVARAYRAVMPDIGERAVSNFFSNLSEPRNLINNILQGKGEADRKSTRLNSSHVRISYAVFCLKKKKKKKKNKRKQNNMHS